MLSSLYSNFKHSFFITFRHWKLLLLSAASDLVFFIALLSFQTKFFFQAAVHVKNLNEIIGEKTQLLLQQQLVDMDKALQETPAFVANYTQLLKIIAEFTAVALALWIVFQGISWFLAHRISGVKPKWLGFHAKFAGFTILWLAILYFLQVLIFQMLHYASQTPLPVFGPSLPKWLGVLSALIIGYLAAVSYTQQGALKQTFIKAWQSAKTLLPAYIAALLLTAILFLDVMQMLKLNYWLGIASAVILLLPGLAVSRVLITTAAKQA